MEYRKDLFMDTENNVKPNALHAEELLRNFRFEDARKEAQSVLAENPNDGRAQYVVMLSNFEVPSIEDLYLEKDILKSEHFKRAQANAKGDFVDILDVFRRRYLEKCEKEWLDAESLFAASRYELAQISYLLLGSYKNSEKRWQVCQEKLGDKAMENKAYNRALEYYTMSGNTQKIAEAKRPLDAIEDFKKEVGNPNTYLKKMLFNKHPKIWREYERLRANPRRGLFESRESKSYKMKKINAANAANHYYTTTIMPKIHEIRDALKAKYADRINREELEKLMKELRFRY